MVKFISVGQTDVAEDQGFSLRNGGVTFLDMGRPT
jgi:hypothetical protein